MAIKRCPNGHFYDPEINVSCPWCAVPADDVERTRPAGPAVAHAADKSATVKLSPGGASIAGGPEDEGRTVAVVKRRIGIDPVVGWLVCI